MKKQIAFFLALVLLLLSLTSCGESSTNSSANDTPAQIATDTQSDMQKPEMSLQEKYPNFKTFGMTAPEMADGLKQFMQQQYPDSMTSEPTIDEDEGDELLPPNKAYTYDIGSGVSLTLYETQETQKLYQAYLYAPKSTDAKSDVLSRVGSVSGLLLAFLEPEESVGQKIMTELNVTDVKTAGTRVSFGDQSNWTLFIDESGLTFNVMAK